MSPCPYCKNKDVSVEKTIGENNRVGCVVCCSVCGMSGPESKAGNPVEAVRGWEILCSRMCNHCRRVYIQRLVELRRRLDARGASGDT